jgi:integrase
MLATLTGEQDEALYLLAVSRGLRLGEILALRWCDLTLDGDTSSVRITHTLERIPRKRADSGPLWRFSPAKTKTSRRTLALSRRLVEAVRHQKFRQARDRLLLGPLWRDHDLVFTTSNGTPLDSSNLRRCFARLLKKAKVRRVRIHDLRHSAATLLLSQAENLKQVSATLGHSRIFQTANRGGKLIGPSGERMIPNHLTKAVEAAGVFALLPSRRAHAPRPSAAMRRWTSSIKTGADLTVKWCFYK